MLVSLNRLSAGFIYDVLCIYIISYHGKSNTHIVNNDEQIKKIMFNKKLNLRRSVFLQLSDNAIKNLNFVNLLKLRISSIEKGESLSTGTH